MTSPLLTTEGEEATGAAGARGADDATPFSTTLAPSAFSPLGNTRVMPPPDAARAARSDRMRLRGAVARLLAIDATETGKERPRVSYCGWSPSGGQVAVRLGGDGIARFAGLQSCASIWLCPCCSARIRQARAADIAEAARIWTDDRGGELLFLTLTVAHTASDQLHVLQEAVMGSWRKLVSSSWWTGDKKRTGARDRYGVGGYVRAIEITDGQRNGWHVHVHALLFVEKGLDRQLLEWLGDEIYERWSRHVVRLGAGLPSRERGVDVQLVDNGKVLAQYLSKVVNETGVGFEMARSDTKRGRKWQRYTPWELAESGDRGDAWARERFVEYASATFGRRCITWSRGLRDELGLTAEKSDAEILAEVDELEERIGEPVMMLSLDEWRAVRNVIGGAEFVLQAVEEERHQAAQSLVTAAVAARCGP